MLAGNGESVQQSDKPSLEFGGQRPGEYAGEPWKEKYVGYFKN